MFVAREDLGRPFEMLLGILNDDVFEAFLNAAASSRRGGFGVLRERRLD
ncbi:hypothetical protein QEV83_03170 [Methylocapsa sp. D3K7]|nr:hypothetical protein [Methylocapsa sp. D3K7]WGJ15307.1 hypothetical protein QEV83_03170 [Methylocapsa sp. D3K7]